MTLPLSRIQQWIPGEIVDYSDTLDMGSWTRMKDAMMAFAMSSVNAFLPAGNVGGIACVPGSGMQVLLQAVSPSPSCIVFLPQRSDDGGFTSVQSTDPSLAVAAYYNPPTGGLAFPVPAPPGTSAPNRTDLVCAQLKIAQVNPQSRAVRSGQTVSQQTCYALDDTCTFTYVVGTPSILNPAPAPTVPAEYVPLYSIAVKNGETSVQTGDILRVIPTYDQIVASQAGGIIITQPLLPPTPGNNFTVFTNGAMMVNGSYYYIFGRQDYHAIVALCISPSGRGSPVQMFCVQMLFGAPAVPLAVGSIMYSIPQPVLFHQDGTLITDTYAQFSGSVTINTAGGSAPVTFSRGFAAASYYRITGLVPFGNFTPWASNKGNDGFTINLPAGATGTVEWTVSGYRVPNPPIPD